MGFFEHAQCEEGTILTTVTMGRHGIHALRWLLSIFIFILFCESNLGSKNHDQNAKGIEEIFLLQSMIM